MVAPFLDGRIQRSMVRVPGSGASDDANLICLNLGNVSAYAARVPVPQNLSFVPKNRRSMTSLMASSFDSSSANQGSGKPTSLPNSDAFRAVMDSSPSESNVAMGGISSILQHPTERREITTSPRGQFAIAPSQTEDVSGSRASRKRPLQVESSGTPSVVSKRSRDTKSTNGFVPTVASNPNGSQPSFVGSTPINGIQPIFVFQAAPSQRIVAQPLVTFQTNIASPGLQNIDVQRKLEAMLQERNQLRMENATLKHRLSCFQQLLRDKQKLSSVLKHMQAQPTAVHMQAQPTAVQS